MIQNMKKREDVKLIEKIFVNKLILIKNFNIIINFVKYK